MQNAGDTITLNMTLTTEYICPMIGEDYFYYIDWTVFEDAMSRLAQDQYQVTDYNERSFSGTFTASREHELVMTTIAYDDGWKVLVDGKEVEIHKALGSLVSFHIDGAVGETHTVELVYSPNTFWIGLTVSLISLAILIVLIILEDKIKKIHGLRALVSVTETPPHVSIFDQAEAQETKDLSTNQDPPSDQA